MDLATHPQRIVVGIDFSDVSNRAFEQAFLLARRTLGAELHLVSIVDRTAIDVLGLAKERHPSLVEAADRLRDELTSIAQLSMSEYRKLHPESRQVPTFVHVRVGSIAEQITQLAMEVGADLVLVGTHGRRGVRRFVLGSVAERVVRLAPCSVLVVRPKDEHAMDEIPAPEPACENCLKVRQETGGKSWWCEPHSSPGDGLHFYARSYRLDDAGSDPSYK